MYTELQSYRATAQVTYNDVLGRHYSAFFLMQFISVSLAQARKVLVSRIPRLLLIVHYDDSVSLTYLHTDASSIELVSPLNISDFNTKHLYQLKVLTRHSS